MAALGDDGHGYVLADLSLSGSPATWAGQAIAGYHKYRANLIVAEAEPRRRHGHYRPSATQDKMVADEESLGQSREICACGAGVRALRKGAGASRWDVCRAGRPTLQLGAWGRLASPNVRMRWCGP